MDAGLLEVLRGAVIIAPVIARPTSNDHDRNPLEPRQPPSRLRLERLVTYPAVRAVLGGVTAAVVGLIAVSAIALARAALTDVWTFIIAAGVLLLLYRTHAKLAVLVAVVGGGVAGWLVQWFMAKP